MKFVLKLLWYVWFAPTIILFASVASLFMGCVLLDTIDGYTFEYALSAFASSNESYIFNRFWDLFCQLPYIEIMAGFIDNDFQFPAYIIISDIAQSALVVIISFLMCRFNRLFRGGKIVGINGYNLIDVLVTSITIISHVGVTILFYWMESFMYENSVAMWFSSFVIMIVSFGIALLIHLFSAKSKFNVVFALVYSLVEIIKSTIDAILVLGIVWVIVNFLRSTVSTESLEHTTFKAIGILIAIPLYILISKLLDYLYTLITNSLVGKLMLSGSKLLNV